MLEGWRNQMLAESCPATIRNQIRQVRAFAAHANAYPWWWSMADEWFADLRLVRHVSVSTVRGYQVAIRGFCRFMTDPAYGWASECERRFGTHPVQVVTEVNSAVHAADSEADPRKRAFTRPELQALFDYADEQVALKRSAGERLNLTVLAALCDIFAVESNVLITTDATNIGVRKVTAGDRPAPPPGARDLRPIRAQVVKPHP
jgi:integrase/recombinase XerC